MESTNRRYNHRIATHGALIAGTILLFSSLSFTQTEQDYQHQIKKFLESEYPNLLQKAKDYQNYTDGKVDLNSALSTEIKTSGLNIHSNAVVEYDQMKENGSDLIIDDPFLAFLINYAGRDFEDPNIFVECSERKDETYTVWYTSENEVSHSPRLRKAIFRIIKNALEVRRLSYDHVIPESCKPPIKKEMEKEKEIVNLVRVPKITVRQQRFNGSDIVLYGMIENFVQNGILTDQETGHRIKVSPIDGFFLLRKQPKEQRFFDVALKYQYNNKFITDRKIVLLR